MDSRKLYESLKKSQEKKGFFFNCDTKRTMELIEGLAVNAGRYGYISCPCRLASGERDEDKDIICPCDYRDADVEEFGTCYCALFVSGEYKEKDVSRIKVPERRPPELMPF